MTGLTLPFLWAQSVGPGGGAAGGAGTSGLANPAAMASLAFRRWCAGLTLCSPDSAPGPGGLVALVAGLLVLLVLVVLVQGPGRSFGQLLDLPGHLRLVRRATRRVWHAGRLVAAGIAFTVLAWTGGQTLSFAVDHVDRGRVDLTLLTRSRARFELAAEQGILAGLTPLRDVAALGDNLPLLICAAYLVFRLSAGRVPPPPHVSGGALLDLQVQGRRRTAGSSYWELAVWGSGTLYALYRLVARAAGSVELPLAGCLIAEVVMVPLLMLVCDGFLLAWILGEIRKAGFEDTGQDQTDPEGALELMPAAALACAIALPARYVGTLVFLASQHMPTSVGTTAVGRYIRWQFGWGLIDLQAVSLVLLGMVGVAVWTRGSAVDVLIGFRRLLQAQGGHLVAAIAMAALAAGILGGVIYPLILLLPSAGWVLPAADSYSHFLTLPVGLWTLAALIELAQHSLPFAVPAETMPASEDMESGTESVNPPQAEEAAIQDAPSRVLPGRET